MNTKIATIILAGLFTTVAFGANDAVIINPSNKSSPASILAMKFKDSIPDSAQWYQAENCQDAKQKFNQTKNAVIAYNSSMDFAGSEKNLDCRLEVKKTDTVVFMSKEYFDICRNATSKVRYGGEKISVGMASMYATKNQELDHAAAGIDITLVPYPGSKDIVTAVINGDVDYGWVGHGLAVKFKDSLDCVYSTNPSSDNYLGKFTRLSIPDFRINMVLYTNSSDSVIISNLQRAALNENFSNFVLNSGIEQINITDETLDSVTDFVSRMKSVWGKK